MVPTCEARRRGRDRTAPQADRAILAPRLNACPAWAELFRHFVDEGIDPFEIRRRVGRVSVDLQVLDLTDKQTRSHLNVDEADLVSDDYATTQAIAAAARDAGFDAVLAPAAALPGCETLAVFVQALPNVDAERSEVRQPPPRLADLLAVIRPHENVPDTVRRLLKTLERIGAQSIRRRRRSIPLRRRAIRQTYMSCSSCDASNRHDVNQVAKAVRAVAAISRSIDRARGRRPASMTAAATWP